MYSCPNCGEELQYDDKVYLDINQNVIGCCFCLEARDAEDAMEEQA